MYTKASVTRCPNDRAINDIDRIVMKPDWRKIEQENQGLAVRSVCFLGEGWNTRAFMVNDELVFRFPKRRDHWEELDREIKFLAFAHGKLPLAVPQYVTAMPDSPAAPCGYAAYRYICGQEMDLTTRAREKSAAAEAIATFLRTLHDLQPNPGVSSILPRENERLVAEEYLARAEREIVPKLPSSEANALRKQFETYLRAPQNFCFQPVVLHADLSKEHVLMKDGAIVGVIDFGDVNWGDPDYDFMYLFVDFGQTFIEEVARKYGHPDIGQLGGKLRFYGIVNEIDTILYGAERALVGQGKVAWRRLRNCLRN